MLSSILENKAGMIAAGIAGGAGPFLLQAAGAAPPIDNPMMQWVLALLFSAATAAGAGVGAVMGKALLAFCKGLLAHRKADALARLRDADPKNDLGAKLELAAIAGGEEAVKKVEGEIDSKK